MVNIQKSPNDKKIIILLGVMMIINQILFVLPGLPVNFQTILDKAPGYSIPDMMLKYSPEKLYEFLEKIGAQGRNAFQLMHVTIDFTFPLIYGLFFFTLIKTLWRVAGKQNKQIPYVSFLASGFDLLENFILVYITDRFPANQIFLAKLAQVSTLLKFFFLILNLILIAYLGYIIQKQKREKKYFAKNS